MRGQPRVGSAWALYPSSDILITLPSTALPPSPPSLSPSLPPSGVSSLRHLHLRPSHVGLG